MQIIRFWQVFSLKEKCLFAFFSFLIIVFGITSVKNFFYYYIVEVPETGGNYTEGVLEEIRFINPILASNETERGIANLVFQSLFRYDSSGELISDMAEGFKLSEDGKVYTVTLKNGLTWHDGKSVTADDVIFTVAMIQNPDFRSSLRANWQGVITEKLDERTVTFTLRQAYAPFAENLTVGIIPKHPFVSIRPENILQSEFNLKPVGSGPYKFKKLTRTVNGTVVSYTVERRPDRESNEPPYLTTIAFQNFGSEETMISNYQRGRIDGMNFISAENVEKIQKPNELYTVRLPQVFAVFFNQSKNKFLSEASVREALDISLDRNELIKLVFRNNAVGINSILPPGSTGYDETLKINEPNITQAKKILNEAGWLENPATGIREKKTPKSKNSPEKTEPLKIVLTTSIWPDLVETADFLSETWKELGIEVKVETFTMPELEHQFIRTRNYEALLFGESYGNFVDPFAFWHSTQIKHPGLNLALYADKKADALMESARRSKNRTEITAKYKELQTLITKARPALFLYTPNYFFVIRSNILGVANKTIIKPSDRFIFADGWHIYTDWKLKALLPNTLSTAISEF